MDWQTYEETVRNIYETLGENYGVYIEGFGNNCKRIGKSGVQHQIDVLSVWGLHNVGVASGATPRLKQNNLTFTQ
jgi:hypothetical protein